jgi:hypothetical protein
MSSSKIGEALALRTYGNHAARGNLRLRTTSCSDASTIARSCRFIFLDWPRAELTDADLPRRRWIWRSKSAPEESS